MSMNFLTDALRRVPEYRALENAVKRGKTPAAVTGVASVHKANIVHALLAETGRPGLLLAGDEAEAARLVEDLDAMGTPAVFYPLRDFSLRDTEGSSHEYERQTLRRTTTRCSAISTGRSTSPTAGTSTCAPVWTTRSRCTSTR